MKKRSLWLLVAALFMVISANMFADIAVKKLSDAEVEVTFTFKMPGYKEVFIAGTMNGWSPTNDLMTLNADGTWTYVLKTSATDAITWKYVADGNWIADLKAPAFTDDGFGGKNGVLDIAAYLAEQSGAATGAAPVAAAGPKLTPIGFGTWSILRADAKYLTKDVAAGEVDGFDFDSALVEAKSYWKLGGDFLPNWNIAIEMQVLQGSVKLFQANTMDGEVPFTTWADGLQDMVDTIFHPFDKFNGDMNPIIGHFHTTLTTPYAKIHTGYKYAKGTNYSLNGMWEVSSAADSDAGKGFTEVSLGDKLTNIADMVTLSAVVAPNKRAGTDGVYSWVNATILSNYVVGLAFNTKTSNDAVFYYFDDNDNMVALGASAAFPDLGLTVKANGLMNFGSAAGVADAVDLDVMAVALGANYKSDMFNMGLVAKLAGDNAYTVYGDDGDLKKGNLFIEITPSVIIDPIDFSLTANMTAVDELADMTDSDITLWAKPVLTVNFKDLIGIDMKVSALGSMNFNIPAADDAEFVYNEAGLKVNVRKLIAFMPNIEFYYTNQWSDTLMKNSILFNLGLQGNMGVTGGAILRTNVSDPVVEDLSICAMGANLGFSMVTPFSFMKKPTFYVNGVYNYDPYDDGQPAFDMGDGYYRADNTDNGTGRANFRAGLVWSF